MYRRLITKGSMSDFYCGAGGSSTGGVYAGVEVVIAANHSETALKTHNHNHPNTDHVLTDLLTASPAMFPYTIAAWFSPECTKITLAAGKKRKTANQLDMFDHKSPDPLDERSRVTMWDVVRFSEYHRYEVVIVENVVDIKYWEPYDAWLKAMESLGYQYKICYFNSMFFHPLNGQCDFAPQSRDRWYAVFWRRGNKPPNLDFRPLAWCETCGKDVQAVQTFKKQVFPRGHYDHTGKHGQYFYGCPTCTVRKNGQITRSRVEPYYYAAWNVIKWELPITRISDRREPLEDNTIRRIEIGLDKYGIQPLLMQTDRSHAKNNRSVTLGMVAPTQTTRQSLAFIMPFKGDPEYQHIRPASEHLPALTTAGAPAVVTTPLLVEMYNHGSCRPLTEAINTVTAGGIKSGIVLPQPFLMSYYGRDNASSSIAQPVPTVPGNNRFALVMPRSPFIASYYNGSNVLSHIGDVVGTIPTVDRHALVTPGEELRVEDCGFRMLEPDECKDAQGFPESYYIYGNKKDQVKQIGNAVSPPPAEFLIKAGIESLA